MTRVLWALVLLAAISTLWAAVSAYKTSSAADETARAACAMRNYNRVGEGEVCK